MNKRLAQSIQLNLSNPRNSSKYPHPSESEPCNQQLSPKKLIQLDQKTIPSFFKQSPHSTNSQQTVKHLFLERFKQRKQILQSTSVYIDTGQMKRKNHTKNGSQIITSLKETSLQKLPYLNRQKRKQSSDRLSQTIDAYSSMNKSLFFQVQKTDSNPSTLTLQSSKTLGKAKMHLAKRRSMNDSIEPNSSFFVNENNSDQQMRNSSPLQRTTNYLGFNEEIKKKYLKSIVDRYFPNEESQNASVQLFYKSTSSKASPVKEQVKPKKPIHTKRPSLNQDKLPSLKLTKRQSYISPPQGQDQTRQHPQSEELIHLPSHETQQYSPTDFKTTIKSNSSALSLSQSYLLEKIQQDEQQIEAHQLEDFYPSPGLYNSSTSHLFSPLSRQTSTELIMNNSSNDLVGLIKDPQTTIEPKPKQQLSKIYENHSFSIFKVKHTAFQNLSQNQDLKTLSVTYEFRKHFLNEPSMELKNRQLKAKQIIMNLCGPCFGQMWQEDPFDKTCLKLNITKNSPPCPGKLLPLTLSKLLYKISPQMQSGSSTFLLIKPTIADKADKPTPFITQQTLLENSHQGLLSLLLNLSLPMSQLSQNLINNRLSLNNIFFRDFNSFSINEWSYSYFKQDFLIQNKKFQKRLEPILKNQFGEWFVTPQYLAPQILENLCFSREEVVKYWVKRQGKKMEKLIVQQHDLFQFGNKSDVWSMGLMVLEIITLIPIWIGEKCMVQNRKNPSITPRKGLLYSQKRDLLKILTKQSYLKENLNKILRIQSQPYIINEWLVKLLHRMLDLDAQKRISFGEIVEILKNEERKLKE